MKKNFFRVISIVLTLSMLMSCFMFSASADGVAPDTAPTRISVVFNGDSATQRGITWYTKANTKSLVEIVDESGNPVNAKIEYAEVFEWEGNFVHKATVSGLEAGKTYYYDVGDETVRSAAGKFVTDNGDSKVDFIAIADIQAGNQENFNKGARVVDYAFLTMPSAEFMVNLGDFTDDSTNEEWDYYDNAMKAINLSTTLAPIAGNHDGLGVENWFNNMFNLDTTKSVQTKDGVNYSFDYGNVHFAVLNTNDILAISIPQLKWLENDMNSTDKDWKIVLMHKSPYSLGKDAKWPDALYLQKALTKVVDKCDVDLVLSGHDHQYLRTKASQATSLTRTALFTFFPVQQAQRDMKSANSLPTISSKQISLTLSQSREAAATTGTAKIGTSRMQTTKAAFSTLFPLTAARLQ